jgi:hypothetical protein
VLGRHLAGGHILEEEAGGGVAGGDDNSLAAALGEGVARAQVQPALGFAAVAFQTAARQKRRDFGIEEVVCRCRKAEQASERYQVRGANGVDPRRAQPLGAWGIR